MKMSRQMKYKTKEKPSWTKRIFLWLERHRRIGQLLDTSVLFQPISLSFVLVVINFRNGVTFHGDLLGLMVFFFPFISW